MGVVCDDRVKNECARERVESAVAGRRRACREEGGEEVGSAIVEWTLDEASADGILGNAGRSLLEGGERLKTLSELLRVNLETDRWGNC